MHTHTEAIENRNISVTLYEWVIYLFMYVLLISAPYSQGINSFT